MIKSEQSIWPKLNDSFFVDMAQDDRNGRIE